MDDNKLRLPAAIATGLYTICILAVYLEGGRPTEQHEILSPLQLVRVDQHAWMPWRSRDQASVLVYPQCSSEQRASVNQVLRRCQSCLAQGCPSGCCMQKVSQNHFFLCLVPDANGGGCCIRAMGSNTVAIATAEITQAGSVDSYGACVRADTYAPGCFQRVCAFGIGHAASLNCPVGIQIPNTPYPYVSPPQCAGNTGENPAMSSPGTQNGSNYSSGTGSTGNASEANSIGDSTAPGNGTMLAPNQTSAPKSTPVNSPGRSCFPESASVELVSGRWKTMRELNVGDRVRVGVNEFSPVFMFTHRVPHTKSLFISIHTASGHTIVVSPGHHIYVGEGIRAARDVKIGDVLVLAAGESAVVQISFVNKNGLYNPQTLQGNIVVDGILATTYTETVCPAIAHAVLAPLRGLYLLFGFSSSVFEQGSPVQAGIAVLGLQVSL